MRIGSDAHPVSDRVGTLLIVLVMTMIVTPLVFQGLTAIFPWPFDESAILTAGVGVQQTVLLLAAFGRLRRTGALRGVFAALAGGWRDVRLGIGWGLALLLVNGMLAQSALALMKRVVGVRTAEVWLAREQQAMDYLFNTTPFYVSVIVGLAVVVAPVAEELFFRGYAYGVMKQHVGKHGIWLSGLLFAGVHMYVVNFLPLFMIGIVLAWLYERHGSLVIPIVAHATVNGFIAALSIAVQ